MINFWPSLSGLDQPCGSFCRKDSHSGASFFRSGNSLAGIFKRRGFSQIELLLAILILMIVFSMGTIVYSSVVRQDQIQTEVQKIGSVINEARMKTIAGYRLGGSSGYNFGVHFEEDSFTLFPGLIYQTGNANNQKYLLPDNLMIEEISWANSGLVFNKVTGEVVDFDSLNNYIVLSDVNLNQQRKISVNFLGTITVENYE